MLRRYKDYDNTKIIVITITYINAHINILVFTISKNVQV